MRARRIVVDSDHDIVLQGDPVAYRLKRSNLRRTIGLKVDRQGLVVLAPMFSALPDIERVLFQHAEWIRNKTQEWRVNLHDAPSFEIGTPVWWLGRQIPLIPVSPKEAIPRVLSDVEAHTLPGIPLAEGVRDARAALTAWYKVQALPWFTRRIHAFTPRLDKKPTRIVLSQAQNRWGSCSHDGIIRLNWRLIQASVEEIDYVVAHECAHLLHMHHGPEFWETVDALYPDWKAVSKLLNARDTLYRQI